MKKAILEYFEQTGRKTPDVLPAVVFAQTELGETFDAIMRSGMLGEGWVRNNERESDIKVELADTYMMLVLAAHALGVDLRQVLAKKMLRKGWHPDVEVYTLVQAILAEFSEQDGNADDGIFERNGGFATLVWELVASFYEPTEGNVDKKDARQRKIVGLCAELVRTLKDGAA